MKKLILSILFASTASADYTCQSCSPYTPVATAIPTATSTATPQPTVTPTHTATPQATNTPNPVVTINFQEDTQAIFPNPGIGWQTTRRTKAQVTNPRNIPLTHATFRTCAHQVNPSPGVFDWSEFDNFLTAANAQGQTTQLGLIMYDPWDCGGWLRNHVPSIQVFCSTENPGRSYWVPDWNHSTAQTRHRELMQAFAAKYNNDPRVDSVDARSAGDFGEWHHSCIKVRATGQAHPMPSTQARRAIIKDYHDFFTKPLVHILDDQISREEALARAGGFRFDCAGGTQHEGPGNLYAQWYANPPMHEHWRDAPIEAEPCGDFFSSTFPIATKVDQLIAKHVSRFNSKNSLSPSNAAWPEVQRLLRKLGYRFVLRRAVINQGLTLHIENVGIAPNYKPLRVENATTGAAVTLSKVMPGETRLAVLPGNVGDVIRFSMDGKAVRTANTTWNGGVRIQ